MNLKKILLSEHSKSVTEKVIRYVGQDETRFHQLMLLFFCNDSVLSQRAAWPVSYIGTAHYPLIKPYLKKMVVLLNKPNIHNSLKRSTLRIFESIDIPKNLIAPVFDLCLKFIQGEMYPIAVRAFSITIACNICNKIPELKNELKMILNSLQDQQQKPAIKLRLSSCLKQL